MIYYALTMRLAGLFCFVLFLRGAVLFGCFKEIMHSCRQKAGQKFLALRSELEDLGMIMPRLKI